jgi:beta-lactamase class D
MKNYPVGLYALVLLLLSCNVNKASIDEAPAKYFDSYGSEGCFTMLNNADGKITVYNMALDTQRFSPASTFKIVSSLVGLETGRILDENMVLPWDGVQRRKEWDRSMNFQEAFKVSNVPYFQEIVRRIGHDTMAQWIDSLSYGNKDISGPIDSFWLNNRLKISPDEQLGLLKRLYFDQLSFRKGVQQIVRNAMLLEDNTLYRLSCKTGAGLDEKGMPFGWACGWVEENRHVYFFVTFARSKKENAGVPMLDLTRDILKDYGFFEGKK